MHTLSNYLFFIHKIRNTKMNSIKLKTLLAGALLLSGASANASTYVVSYTNIDNFLVTGASVTGWTFNQNMATTSDGSSSSNGAIMDAAPSCVNCTYDNSFTNHGTSATPYAYGDTLISSSDVTGAGGSASAIAEVYATNGIDGNAFATNSMTAFMTTSTANSTVDFSFDVNSYLGVFATGNDIGFANRSFQLSVYDSANNYIGVTLPSYLNRGIGPIDAEQAINESLNFSLNGLAIDQYRLNISMSQSVFTTLAPVPVPAEAWLFGSGLLALVGCARRRK